MIEDVIGGTLLIRGEPLMANTSFYDLSVSDGCEM